MTNIRKPAASTAISVRCALTAACLLASTFALLPLPAPAAEFVSVDDRTVSGEIIRFTKSTVTIRPAGGSMIMLAPDTIKHVRYPLDDGSTLEGLLHDWYDGIYVLDVQEKLIGVKDGAVVSEAFPSQADEQQDGSVEAGTSSNAADGEDQDGLVEIKATADVTSEEAKELVFDISASKALDDDIIILFATLDGTAEAGTDFESKHGVVRLPAGSTSVELSVPLIDDDIAEDDERLTLFLSSAIDVATIPERKVTATIRDND